MLIQILFDLLVLFLIAGLTIIIVNQNNKIYALEQHDATNKKAIETLAQEQAAMIKADLFFSRQLKELNEYWISLDAQLQELANARENDGAYQQAVQILKNGGTRAEIIKSCHLSTAEADLLVNLHTYKLAMNS